MRVRGGNEGKQHLALGLMVAQECRRCWQRAIDTAGYNEPDPPTLRRIPARCPGGDCRAPPNQRFKPMRY